jgi:quinol monooxygenase YgiN
MIYLIASFEVKPEHREAYLAGSKKVEAEVRKEKGCISYDLHESVAEPNKFVMIERWETQADLDAHGQAPHVLAWRAVGGPMRVAPAVLEVITPAQVVKR